MNENIVKECKIALPGATVPARNGTGAKIPDKLRSTLSYEFTGDQSPTETDKPESNVVDWEL